MANKNISGLTAATVPLAGTELVPVWDGIGTKKVSVDNLTAGKPVAATQFTASTGDFIPATSGKGMDFSAHSSAGGMTSKVLVDYEEGTWTPTDASGAGLTFTLNTTSYYVKVGSQATCHCDITFPTTSDANIARITLPFAPKVSGAGGMVGYTTKVNGYYLSVSTGGNFVFVDLAGNFLTNANMSTFRGQLAFSYRTA